MGKKYEDISIKELEAVLQDFGNQIRTLRAERHKAKMVWNSRQDEVEAIRLADSLPEGKKKALAQVLNPKGIDTKAKVGSPGAN